MDVIDANFVNVIWNFSTRRKKKVVHNNMWFTIDPETFKIQKYKYLIYLAPGLNLYTHTSLG